MNNISFVRKYIDSRGIHYDVIYKNSREVNYYSDFPKFISEFIRNSKTQVSQYNDYFNRNETLFF